MLDTILSQLAETRDRQAVMILLQGLDAPLSVLTIRGDTLTGKLWIANGKHLCYAKVLPDGEGGLIDMLRLLAIKDADFSLEVADGDPPPKLAMQVALAEVVADEHAVARKIKNVLWPVSEEAGEDEPVVDIQPPEAAAQAEAVTDNVVTEPPPKKKKKSKKKLLAELEETKVRLADSDAPSAKSKKGDQEKPEPKGKGADADVAFILTEPISKEAELDLIASLSELTEKNLNLGAVATPDESSAKEVKPAPLSPLAEMADELQSLGATLSAGKEAGAAVAADADKAKPQADQAKPQADKISDPPVTVLSSSTTVESIGTAGVIESAADAADDALSSKRRAEYEAMNIFMGEEPAKFYEGEDAFAQLSEDKLDQQRQEEMLALAAMLSEKHDEYKAKPASIEREEGSDEFKTKRQADYEALKLFYAEEPEKFEEAVGLADQLAEGGLSDFQKRILEIANQEAPGDEVFAEVDAKLTEEGHLRPAWDTEAPPKAEEEPAAPAAEEEKPNEALEASPYIDSASSIGRNQTLRSKLALNSEEQSTELLDRKLERGKRDFATAPESAFRRQPFPRKLIVIGVAGVIGIPLSAFTLWHFFDAQAQEDLAMQRESALLAQRSIEKTSVVEKPQEPFRMPAGAMNSSPPQQSHQNSTETASGITAQQREAHYDWSPPAGQQQYMTNDQMATANSEIQKADGFLNAGYADRAVALYVPLCRQYPSYVQLRIKTARAYMAMKHYREAYQVCVSGLGACQTRGDFDSLVNLIREIP